MHRQKLKPRQKYASLPPHSWEPQPFTTLGETTKSFTILIISLVLVVIIALGLFISSRFVGKAIEGAAGDIINIVAEGGVIKIIATLATAKTGGAYLELLSPTEGFDLCAAPRVNTLWHEFAEESCTEGRLSFGDATLNEEKFKPAEGQSFTILEIMPPVSAPRTLQFTLDPIDVYDAATGKDLFLQGGSFEVILAPGVTGSCGNVVVDAGENCLTCPVDAPCAAGSRCDAAGTCVPGVGCGNRVVEVGEECDDGNTIAGDGCSAVCMREIPATPGIPGIPSGAPSETGVPAPAGGGSGRCLPQWICTEVWSYCNASLQQSRVCTDKNKCDWKNPTKLENRSCLKCEESWICSIWSSCQADQQYRSCADEHRCGTLVQRPVLSKSCTVAVPPGPAPQRVIPQPPEIFEREYFAPKVQQPKSVVGQIWDNYKVFILGIPAFALLVLVIGLFVHHHISRQKVYNYDDLHTWIAEEMEAGTSREDTIDIIAQHTGWGSEEIQQTFPELSQEAKSTSGSSILKVGAKL